MHKGVDTGGFKIDHVGVSKFQNVFFAKIVDFTKKKSLYSKTWIDCLNL